MKCKNCQLNKLSREFANDIISSKCQHVPNFCLKCIVNHLDTSKTNQCPECKSSLSQKEVQNLILKWKKAPFKIDVEIVATLNPLNDPSKNQVTAASGYFYVIMINGHKIRFSLETIKTVIQLKRAIKSEINIQINKQKLIYNGNELTDFKSNNSSESTLAEYKIVEDCHIQLIVLLYSITKNQSLKSLTFDLQWGYPNGKIDYLDGTCLLYKDDTFFRKYDYLSKLYNDIPSMYHSGDRMDSTNQIGHHSIKANLSDLPPSITKLYFILSSWNSPDIGCFPNPSFKLYDTERPEDQLCSYKLKSAANSKAVIMCAVTRNKFKNTWDENNRGLLNTSTTPSSLPLVEKTNELLNEVVILKKDLEIMMIEDSWIIEGADVISNLKNFINFYAPRYMDYDDPLSSCILDIPNAHPWISEHFPKDIWKLLSLN
ncbi:722_t:CDS:2 [Entrophospora sp. SA101]|nr:722_t:CDS:2 [Entrophospora sp. SA101]